MNSINAIGEIYLHEICKSVTRLSCVLTRETPKCCAPNGFVTGPPQRMAMARSALWKVDDCRGILRPGKIRIEIYDACEWDTFCHIKARYFTGGSSDWLAERRTGRTMCEPGIIDMLLATCLRMRLFEPLLCTCERLVFFMPRCCFFSSSAVSLYYSASCRLSHCKSAGTLIRNGFRFIARLGGLSCALFGTAEEGAGAGAGCRWACDGWSC